MIIDELRTCAALTEDGDLMREAAARIEVCLEAIEAAIAVQPTEVRADDNIEMYRMLKHLRAARYALLAERPQP